MTARDISGYYRNTDSIDSEIREAPGIKIRYFFIKQFLDSGEFEIEHCPTDIMLADLLTKPLQGQKFLAMRDKLLGRPTN
jgi:hypothetical protein